MAFKEIKGEKGVGIRWTETPKDDKQRDSTIYLGPVVTGYYIGMKSNVGQNNSNVYEIKLEDGKVVSIWGSGLLDERFEQVPLNCLVRVTYKGIAQPKKPTGRPYQNFLVEFDADAKMPMSVANKKVETPATQAPEGSEARANDDFDNVGKDTPASSGDGY